MNRRSLDPPRDGAAAGSNMSEEPDMAVSFRWGGATDA
jgi:hypothetical protein